MRRLEIQWTNFRGLQDTGWVKIKPITVIIGANATGKTSLIAPLLILKQSLESSDPSLALKTEGALFNAGSYEDLIYRHDTNRELSFALRFVRKSRARGEELDIVGEYPPGEVEFTFTSVNGTPVLQRYLVRDIYGRLLLERERLETGRYSVRGINLSTQGRDFRQAIRKSSPERFLFTPASVFRYRFESQHRHSKDQVEIQEAESRYLGTVTFTAGIVQSLLSNISYIGPLRERPRRLYEVSGEHPANVGTRGEFAPEILFRRRDTELINLVNKWVGKFDFGLHLECNLLTQGAFNITLRRKKTSPSINLSDTGFGLSQILPLIVQGFYANAQSMIIFEQPEIHLNPRLQSLLADLFCAVAARRVGMVVETHSEHFLLRLRRLIAEEKIKAADVALYYVEKHLDRSMIREIPVKGNGHIESEQWPRGFFEDTLRESFSLAAAQAKRRKAGRVFSAPTRSKKPFPVKEKEGTPSL